jgi:hypothetical protein
MRTLHTQETAAVTGALGYALAADPAAGIVTAYATEGALAIPIKLNFGTALTSLVALALKAFPKLAYQG